jgi:hypothetical protein
MSIPRVALRGLSQEQALTRHAESINGLIAGKADVVGYFTLADGVTETDVEDNKFESLMVPVWVPLSAAAAAAMDVMFLSDRTQGGFTVTHDNTADTDRNFAYVRFG